MSGCVGPHHLEQPGAPHSSSHAHRRDHPLRGTTASLEERMADEASPRDPEWVTERNGAAVHVETIGRDAESIATVDDLHRKGLIEFPKVDVVHAQAAAAKELRHGERWANAHFVRFATGHRERTKHAERS